MKMLLQSSLKVIPRIMILKILRKMWDNVSKFLTQDVTWIFISTIIVRILLLFLLK